MRARDDLKVIRFEMSCAVTIDLERVEQDPVWLSVCRYYDLSQPGQAERAMHEYLRHYLKHENLLAEMPVTCGPADIYFVRFPGAGNREMEKKDVPRDATG